VGRMTQLGVAGTHLDSTTSYLTGMNYNSAQLPTGFTYGNGVQASFAYNDHLELSSLSYVSGSNTLLNLTYNYGDANGNNNGQIQGITDSRGAAFSTTYTYDPFGRLSQAQTNDLTSANTWRLAWGYDRYGNRLSQTLTGGTAAVGQPQLTVDPGTNHISTTGFTYDANGNAIHDPNGVYTFDASNRMTQSVVGSVTTSYAYDGNNLRVVKGANTAYIFSGSKVIAEYASGSLTKEYIYSGSKLVATVAGSAVTYHHADHLSNRVETDPGGNTARTFGQLPFGESWYETGTADKWKLTSYERDTVESGLDYAMMRYYGSVYGRFTTTDPLPGNARNPQSLNHYAYVVNDPVNAVDPYGLLTNCTQYHLENCGFPIGGGPDVWITLNTGIPLFFAGSGHGGGGGGGARDKLPAAVQAALNALKNPDCANAVGQGQDSDSNEVTASDVLKDLASNVDPEYDSPSHFGKITFGPISPPVTISGTTAVVSAETQSHTYTTQFGGITTSVTTTITMNFNNKEGTFVTGSLFDQTVTLLHELGHAMKNLLPYGSSQVLPDDPNSTGGQDQSKANTQLIKDKCLPGQH
jgi:RHS repeat-associated protein